MAVHFLCPRLLILLLGVTTIRSMPADIFPEIDIRGGRWGQARGHGYRAGCGDPWAPISRPGYTHRRRPGTIFRCTTWGAILPLRHPPRLVRAPSIRGRRRTSRAFGLCRSEARDGGIARQPGLGSKPDRRVHRAVPMVAAPLDNLEEKASLLGPRIDLEELGTAIAIVENISCAQPVNLRRVKIGPRLQIVVVVLGDRQDLDGVGPQLLDGAEDVLGRE